MALHKNLGNIQGTYEEMQFQWNIPNFSVIAGDETFKCCESPVFYFGNASWFFQLWPVLISRPKQMALHLRTTKNRQYPVEYTLGLKRMDNSVERLVTGVLRADVQWIGGFMKKSNLLEQENKLTPSDVLTITCTLKRGAILLNNAKPKKLIKLETLSENFKNVSHNKESCNVTLHVKDKEYKVHKTVLIARSPVFAAMFQHDTLENQTGVVTIPDCDPQSFQTFLQFLYSGKLEELSPNDALNLYETSEKYNVQELKNFCSEHLMENLTVRNLCDVVSIADKHDDAKLLSAIQRFFNNNLNKVLETSEWEYLMKNDPLLANKLMVEMSKKVKVVD